MPIGGSESRNFESLFPTPIASGPHSTPYSNNAHISFVHVLLRSSYTSTLFYDVTSQSSATGASASQTLQRFRLRYRRAMTRSVIHSVSSPLRRRNPMSRALFSWCRSLHRFSTGRVTHSPPGRPTDCAPTMSCIGFTARDAIHLLACSTAQFTPNGAPARHTLWTCSGRSGSSGDSHEHVPTSAVPLQRSLSSTLRSSLLCIEQDSVLRTIPTDAACVFADLISAALRSGQS